MAELQDFKPVPEVVHKFVIPIPLEGVLNHSILCWRYDGKPEDTTNTRFSTNINYVNCPRCNDLWVRGKYA